MNFGIPMMLQFNNQRLRRKVTRVNQNSRLASFEKLNVAISEHYRTVRFAEDQSQTWSQSNDDRVIPVLRQGHLDGATEVKALNAVVIVLRYRLRLWARRVRVRLRRAPGLHLRPGYRR